MYFTTEETNGQPSHTVILTFILHFLIFGKPNLSVLAGGQFSPKIIDKKIEEKLEKKKKKTVGGKRGLFSFPESECASKSVSAIYR